MVSRTMYEARSNSDQRRSDAVAARDKRRRMLLRRVRFARTILLGIILTMMGALINLQAFTSTDAYPGIGESQMRTKPILALRGAITDRSGDALAATIEVRNVFVDQMMVGDAKKEAKLLAPLLHIDANLLQQKMIGTRRYVMLKEGISQSLWAKIAELNLAGIGADRAQLRSYPEGMLTSNLLGHLDYAGVAKEGLEKTYNDLLAGVNGQRSVFGGASTAANDIALKSAVDGSHLQLTIDRGIQAIAQLTIAAKVKEARAESGTVIVMNAKTGEILAMATAPTFDPDNITSETANYLSNRAVSEAYEPGSTGKVMTMASLIDAGVVTPASKFKVPYRLKRSDGEVHDHKGHPLLKLTLAGILAKSSNTGTVLAAEKLDKDVLHKYFKAFGMGELTGANLDGESRGIFKPASEWYGLTRYNVMFGQGYSVTPLQATSIFATIANGGVRVPPRIVAGVTDPSGRFTAAKVDPGTRVVSAEAAKAVREMMESVVSDEGTAPKAKIPGYRVAGKTGTAQVWNQSCGCWKGYVASFIGFAPADNPELVVAVNLVKPKNGHYGGVLAAPVFKKVMTVALEQLHLPATGKKSPKLPLTW